jgi:hypothetical protein
VQNVSQKKNSGLRTYVNLEILVLIFVKRNVVWRLHHCLKSVEVQGLYKIVDYPPCAKDKEGMDKT